MKAEVPDWQWHLRTQGLHARPAQRRPIRPLAAGRCRASRGGSSPNLEQHLLEALGQVEHAIVMTHHPAFHGISFPTRGRLEGLDALLWEALTGNRAMETVLEKHADRMPLIFSGHTHRDARGRLGPSRATTSAAIIISNACSCVDWPAGTIETFIFGDPKKRR